MPDDIVEAAEKFGKEIKERFANPIAKTKKVIKKKQIVLKWKKAQEINTIVLMENIKNGQKVAAYELEAYVNGEWVKMEPQNNYLAWKPYPKTAGFETIGHKKIDRVTPVVTNRIRFTCTKSVSPSVEMRSIAVYNCKPYKK